MKFFVANGGFICQNGKINYPEAEPRGILADE
jgi:hypothetical protein